VLFSKVSKPKILNLFGWSVLLSKGHIYI
jgi:hypothetical protein